MKKNTKIEVVRIVHRNGGAYATTRRRAQAVEADLNPTGVRARHCTASPTDLAPMLLLLPEGIYSFVRDMPEGRMLFKNIRTQEVLLLPHAEPLREFMRMVGRLRGKAVTKT
jgi:hypothetical protein